MSSIFKKISSKTFELHYVYNHALVVDHHIQGATPKTHMVKNLPKPFYIYTRLHNNHCSL